LSDLHFGRVDARLVEPLVDAVWQSNAHLIVVTGDFVQNGTRTEFEQAREFVRRLPEPWIAVPGNHDMPFRNIINRFAVGLDYFREYVTPEVEPYYLDDEIAVMGVNTARVLPLRNGRINQQQVERVERTLCSVGGGRVRILATHHPFDLDDSYNRRELVGRARMAMGRLAQSIDVLLAGHMHMSQAGRTAVRYGIQGASAVFVQAGTATSTRGRGEPNRFNLLRIEGRDLTVERRQWSGDEFRCTSTEKFALDRETCAVPAEVAEEEVYSDFEAS
jgi:3',5'-cyclic AMP phosphodiesterase CpdA